MKRKQFTALLLAALLVLGAGCTTPRPDMDYDPGPNSGPSAHVAPSGSDSVALAATDAKALIAPQEADAAAQTVAEGANDFAFRLSAELVREAGEDNFLLSPYSVWLPLAALVNATEESQRDELLAALGAQGVTAEDVNRAASRMLFGLTNQSDRVAHNPLQIANAVMVRNDRTLSAPFAEVFMDYYRGQVMSVDFASNEAVDAVNQWASDNTDGLIESILEELNPEAVAVIANAIYFSDRWDWEFSPGWTTEDVFYAPSGETTARFMRRESDGLSYYEDERLQAMPLRFANGGTMYILLPKDGDAVDLLASMDADYFAEIQRHMGSSSGKLLLPKFRIESGVFDLVDALEALGVPLFDEASDPLSGLIETPLPVHLTTAVQSAVIEVDEQGATAAAVTVMVAAEGTAAPDRTEPFEMICDRPFVFLLCERTYDGGQQVLFSGVVNRPA